MYIFIATIFIAELIIAIQLVLLILKADKKICDINDCVKEFNPLAKTCMQYIRCISQSLCCKVVTGISFVKKQREKVIIKTISTMAIYAMLVFFKTKKIKKKKIFNLVGAIRDIVLDFAI